jgi:F0F1-type ATP synthase membrane subunit b/b'
LSNKVIWGALIGAATAITAALVYDAFFSEDDEEVYWEDEDSSEIIDKANDYLSEARVKARELVDYANKRSDELLGEANSILLIAKEKAERVLTKGDSEAIEELENAKSEIDRLITDYEKKLK